MTQGWFKVLSVDACVASSFFSYGLFGFWAVMLFMSFLYRKSGIKGDTSNSFHMNRIALVFFAALFVIVFVIWFVLSKNHSKAYLDLECLGRIDSGKVAARNSHYFYISGEWTIVA